MFVKRLQIARAEAANRFCSANSNAHTALAFEQRFEQRHWTNTRRRRLGVTGVLEVNRNFEGPRKPLNHLRSIFKQFKQPNLTLKKRKSITHLNQEPWPSLQDNQTKAHEERRKTKCTNPIEVFAFAAVLAGILDDPRIKTNNNAIASPTP